MRIGKSQGRYRNRIGKGGLVTLTSEKALIRS